MKKRNVINLIKYYTEKNDSGFIAEAYEIAKDFDKNGDYQLSEYSKFHFLSRFRKYLSYYNLYFQKNQYFARKSIDFFN